MYPSLPLSILRNLFPFTHYPYRGARSACPVCGCEQVLPVARLDRRLKLLPTVACEECGLFFTNPLPTDAELERYYRHFYRFDYQWSVSAPSARHRAKRKQEADRRLSQVLDLLPQGARTLDFGAGSGEFVSAMMDAGLDAHGFEPGEVYGGYAKDLHQERITIAEWQQVDYARSFDMISSFHVFEHLADPVAAIRKAATWLRPGGLFYIEVPDMPQMFAGKGFGAFHFAHIVGFNHGNLCLAAALAGLEPVRKISDTGVVFRKVAAEVEQAVFREQGRAQTRLLLETVSVRGGFIRHTTGKLGRLIGMSPKGRGRRPVKPAAGSVAPLDHKPSLPR